MFLTVVTTGVWSGIVSFDGLRDINVSVCRGLVLSLTIFVAVNIIIYTIDNVVGNQHNKVYSTAMRINCILLFEDKNNNEHIFLKHTREMKFKHQINKIYVLFPLVLKSSLL